MKKKELKDVVTQTNDNSNSNGETSLIEKNKIVELKSNETITIVANKLNIICSDANCYNQNPVQMPNSTNSTYPFNLFQSDNIWTKKQKHNSMTNNSQPTKAFKF